MYIFVVEHWNSRIGFKTVDEAEKFIEIMYGEESISKPTIVTVLMAGE